MKAHLDFNKVSLIELLRSYGGFSLATRDTLNYDNFEFKGIARLGKNGNRFEFRVAAWKDGALRKTYGFAYIADHMLEYYVRSKFDLKQVPTIKLMKVELITIGYRLTFDIENVYKK